MGYPPGQDWVGYPPGLDEVPPSPTQDWMAYHPPLDSSIVSTCYAAGSMSLAFTQDDFLVSTGSGLQRGAGSAYEE